VARAAVPLYPPLARAARVQGVVHLKVTTDGHRVVATHVEDGNKLLADAAEENARTWEFATHDATTFTMTYHYKLDPKFKGIRKSIIARRKRTLLSLRPARISLSHQSACYFHQVIMTLCSACGRTTRTSELNFRR